MKDSLRKVDALLNIIAESSSALEEVSEGEIDKLLAAEGFEAAKAVASIDAAFERAFLSFRKTRLSKAKGILQDSAKKARELASRIPSTPDSRRALL